MGFPGKNRKKKIYMIVVAPNVVSTKGYMFGKHGISHGNKGDWYLAIYNDISGSEPLEYVVEAYATRDVQCTIPTCSYRGDCDVTVGKCICRYASHTYTPVCIIAGKHGNVASAILHHQQKYALYAGLSTE